MAEYPALPLFTDAFIADTVHLTAAQTGAYLMLLMVAWRTKDCSLPDDDAVLARFARMDNRAWAVNKSAVLAFWHKNDVGRLVQKRLLDERIFVAAKRDQAVHAGRASALKRKERHSTGVSTKRQRNVNPHTHTHTHTHTHIKKDNNKLLSKKVLKPETVPDELWNDFLKLRKDKKAAVTETALRRIENEAKKINWPIEQALAEMCARGWQGFKADWILNKKGKNNEENFRNHKNYDRAEHARSVVERALGESIFTD